MPTGGQGTPAASDGATSGLSYKQLSEGILEHVNVWVNVIDPELRILAWNPMAERTTGYPKHEVLGSARVWQWLYPDSAYRAWVVSRSKDIMLRDQPVNDWETTIRCRDGQEKWIAWRSCVLAVDDAGAGRAITFGYDVTERRRSEARLRRANSDLAALYEVASVASAANDPNEVFSVALRRALAALHCQKGFLHVWDDLSGMMKLEAHVGLTPGAAKRLLTVPAEGTLLGAVRSRGVAVEEPDAWKSLGHEGDSSLRGMFHAYVGVPLVARGRIEGVLSVLTPARTRISENDRALLTSIGEQVGFAVNNARLAQQARHAASLEERRRLARDMHDSISQSLYSLTLLAEAGSRKAASGDLESARKSLLRVRNTADEAVRTMRVLLYELRPLDLNPGELVRALQQRLDAVERRLGISAYLSASQVPPLPIEAEQQLFGIAVEALNNALQHSHGSRIRVDLGWRDDHVVLRIEDDGQGIRSPEQRQSTRGMANMRERARDAGAELTIHSAPGEGTCVEVTLELRAAGSHAGDAPYRIPALDVPDRP